MQNEEVKVLEQEALSWPIRAREIQVFDQATYDMATGLLLTIAALKRKIEDYHSPLKDAAFKAHKAICAAEKGLLTPLDEARAIISPRLIEWQQDQERIRLELERKAREEASRQEEERRLAMAVEAEKLGAPPETVTAILEEECPAPMPMPVAPTYRPAAGISERKTWAWRVTDIALIPREYMKVDDIKINGVVRAMQSGTRIPGIEVYQESGLSVRRSG